MNPRLLITAWLASILYFLVMLMPETRRYGQEYLDQYLILFPLIMTAFLFAISAKAWAPAIKFLVGGFFMSMILNELLKSANTAVNWLHLPMLINLVVYALVATRKTILMRVVKFISGVVFLAIQVTLLSAQSNLSNMWVHTLFFTPVCMLIMITYAGLKLWFDRLYDQLTPAARNDEDAPLEPEVLFGEVIE